MRNNRTLGTQTGDVTDMSEAGQKCKYLLPKLKSYSQNNCSTYANISVKKQATSHFASSYDRNLISGKTEDGGDLSKLSLIKYQYVNKSPNYFKRQQRSMNSVRMDEYSYHQPVQNYVQSKMKQFDKQALIDLVSNRVKSVKHGTNSNKKFTTLQNHSNDHSQSPDVQTKLIKTKIGHDKLKMFMSSSRITNLQTKNQPNSKTHNIQRLDDYQKSKNQFTSKNKSNWKPMGVIKESHEQDYKKFKTIQHKSIEFYDTKYSNFAPNKIENVKNHIKSIKKHPSLKLDPYHFY